MTGWPGLPTDATVARQLAHRSTVEGVFVTGVAAEGDILFAVGQLPRTHLLHNDVTNGHHDTLLLAEVIRQSVEVIAHALLEVPLSSQFVLRSLRVTIEDPAATVCGAGVTPFCVTLPAHRVRRRRGGAVHRIDGPLSCLLDGVIAATFDGSVVFLHPDVYQAVRGPAGPMEIGAGPCARQGIAAAASVGRGLDGNVLITEPAGPAHAASAEFRPSRHSVFFDRPLDHFPGMMLAEAGRQLAVSAVSLHGGADPARLRTEALNLEFVSFAELDGDIGLRVTDLTPAPGGAHLTEEIHQAGRHVATAAYTLVTEDEVAS